MKPSVLGVMLALLIGCDEPRSHPCQDYLHTLPPAYNGYVTTRCLHPSQTYVRTDRDHIFCRCPRGVLP